MARDTLETLIRLGRFEVDEKRRALRDILDREQALRDEVAMLEAQERAEQSFVAEHVEQAGFYGSYSAANKRRREAVLEKIAAIIPEIEAARDSLADAFAAQKRYEIAFQNREEAARAEEGRREREELDELALNAHRRDDDGH